VLVSLAIAAGCGVIGGGPDLVALDRGTGVQRWRVDLPGDLVDVHLSGRELVVRTCSDAYALDPASGRRVVVAGLNRQAGVGPQAVYWRDPGPELALPVSSEFDYDRATKSLVSRNGWSMPIEVGSSPWIPVLMDDDRVYVIERYTYGCSQGD